MKKDYWKSNVGVAPKGDPNKHPKLTEDITTDVCVVGGGLAGLMCAYELASRGHKVVALEADRVGGGEVSRSTAMLTFCHDLVYSRLIKKHGEEVAKKYLENQMHGLKKLFRIIRDEKIDCDFTPAGMVLFSTTWKGKRQIRKERRAFNKLGVAYDNVTETELPYKTSDAMIIANQAHINPKKFMDGLHAACVKKGVQIFEQTPVNAEPKDNVLRVGTHSVTAEKIIMATHFPYLILPGFYFIKMYQHRSHNIVFKSTIKLNNMYESAEDTGFEYRQTPDGVLCGGANIRTGKYKHNSQYKIVEEHLLNEFGVTETSIVGKFSAQDCMTFDMLPFIGRYSSVIPDLYVITGFNKWGFTNAAVGAEILADMCEGKEVENIFEPSRFYTLKNPIKAAKNTATILGSFANLLVSADSKKLRRLNNGQGAIVKFGCKRVGVYRDQKGEYYAVSGICTHMGCNLRWNKDEASWDCPCHGSRFTPKGDVINGPAIEEATVLTVEKTK